ncbi:helix-turn-helix domain-containing protein [Enterovibrio sp. ZSDZ42]|uniref:Helix-turn-helix domain-containing protein n=1 Tax=Enterovibrio gelatinilyticus TaxID=2899819 RepID=A0ABT5R1X6_9GAMM|nr:helix-turn-helix domain-containing protein [Enterovibrio sp. ZSDZ42]MDD1794266.1 helix-turn-helix domain-containing protein [Enterovibrio sp. ZSDZ42]
MGRLEAKVPPFEYLKGKEIVDKLKESVGVDIDLQLADVFGVPKGTIGTWKQRELTPYELILRTCLAYDVNLEALALGKGELFKEGSTKSLSETLIAKQLEGGQVKDLEPISFDKSLLTNGLDSSNCVVYKSDSETLFVNIEDTNPSSGRYLIDIDGVISITKLQRLPGGKVSMQFDNAPVVVEVSDLKVVGKVAMSLVRE